MMNPAHILVIADTPEAARHLAEDLLPAAGYQISLADKPPSDTTSCDAVLVDISLLRGSTLAQLKSQRLAGVQAPALLCAPRITTEMAEELFTLNVRDFIRKPLADSELMQHINRFVAQVRDEKGQAELRRDLAHTHALLVRRLEEMNVLSRIGRAITSISDTDVILSRIVEAGVYLTWADEGLIFLLDESSNTLTLQAHHGLNDAQIAAVQQSSPDSTAMTVLQTGKPVVKGSGGQEVKIATDYLVKAAIAVPIFIGKEIIGVISAHNHRDRVFEPADEVILVTLADYAAIALGKAYLVDQAQARIERALEIARLVRLHVETLFDPIDGIEAQVDVLLGGGLDPLTEAQHSAVARIKLAAERLQEIGGLIRDTYDQANQPLIPG